MALSLKKEELIIIGEYVQEHLSEWLPEQTYRSTGSIYPIKLGERMVRVEEELKNQRELMKQGFDQIDKRMEQMQVNMDKRFEQVDKRFDDVNTRLKAIETKMFQFMVWSTGFTATVAGIVVGIIKFT
jgi:tetrahydromethanopterin S-methyltransferase subunit G